MAATILGFSMPRATSKIDAVGVITTSVAMVMMMIFARLISNYIGVTRFFSPMTLFFLSTVIERIVISSGSNKHSSTLNAMLFPF